LSSLTNAVVVISEGQAVHMESESRAEVTEKEYVKIKKTAELFAVSAEIGGLLADIDNQRISNLKDYGMNLGIAFQIADDILGFTTYGKELGKPIYSDIRKGKKIIYKKSNFRRPHRGRYNSPLRRGRPTPAGRPRSPQKRQETPPPLFRPERSTQRAPPRVDLQSLSR